MAKKTIKDYNKTYARYYEATKTSKPLQPIDFAGAQRKDNAVKTVNMQTANGYQESLGDVVHNR